MKETAIESKSHCIVDTEKAERPTGTKRPWSTPELQEVDYELTGAAFKNVGSDMAIYS
jgi:hypothetical protein